MNNWLTVCDVVPFSIQHASIRASDARSCVLHRGCTVTADTLYSTLLHQSSGYLLSSILFQYVGDSPLQFNCTLLCCEPCSTPFHPAPPSWTPDLRPSLVNTGTSLRPLLISSQIRAAGLDEGRYQAAERRGLLGQLCRCHSSPTTSWDNIRQGLNQQTGLTLCDQVGYLQLCGEGSI